jgi:hypothetical protein
MTPAGEQEIGRTQAERHVLGSCVAGSPGVEETKSGSETFGHFPCFKSMTRHPSRHAANINYLTPFGLLS